MIVHHGSAYVSDPFPSQCVRAEAIQAAPGETRYCPSAAGNTGVQGAKGSTGQGDRTSFQVDSNERLLLVAMVAFFYFVSVPGCAKGYPCTWVPHHRRSGEKHTHHGPRSCLDNLCRMLGTFCAAPCPLSSRIESSSECPKPSTKLLHLQRRVNTLCSRSWGRSVVSKYCTS